MKFFQSNIMSVYYLSHFFCLSENWIQGSKWVLSKSKCELKEKLYQKGYCHRENAQIISVLAYKKTYQAKKVGLFSKLCFPIEDFIKDMNINTLRYRTFPILQGSFL